MRDGFAEKIGDYLYLIGSELTGNTGFASMVLVQRVRKNLKKYYHVLDIQRYPFDTDVSDCIKVIEAIYKNPDYTIRKPRFSQIGRPKKIVNERPLIFMICEDNTSGLTDNLKRLHIPANCVFVNDEDSWYSEVPGKCLKSDFYIPKRILIRNMLAVIEENRLVMKTEEIAGVILKVCKEYKDGKHKKWTLQYKNPLDDLILALAMPVWYYENLLAIRPRTP